jgi:hypothetical protein
MNICALSKEVHFLLQTAQISNERNEKVIIKEEEEKSTLNESVVFRYTVVNEDSLSEKVQDPEHAQLSNTLF